MDWCRWLVTGGAGFIGSNLVVALAARGDRVRALDNLVTGRWSNLDAVQNPQLVERITADVRDPKALVTACDGVDVVFHQAALCSVPGSFEDPIEYERVNLGGTAVVLECARQAGVRRVVLATSAAVYGDDPSLPKRESMPVVPKSPYAWTKAAAESCLRFYSVAHGLETVGLRYFNVFGPHQLPTGPYAAAIPKFISAILQGRPVVVFGDGEQTRDFCTIEDVVRANLMAAQASRPLLGEAINIAGGKRISINELLQEMQHKLGRHVEVQYEAPRVGDIRHSLGSIDLAREVLGWKPEIEVSEGLAPTAAFLTRALQQGELA